MSLFEQIQNDLKEAVKSGNTEAKEALRMLVSDIKNEVVNQAGDRANIPNDIVQTILSKAVKSRKESIRIFTEQNRFDLVEIEKNQLKYLEKYLPAQLSDEDLQKIVEKVKSENPNLQGMALMGRIMPLVKGQADPERIKSFLN
jgi:uncharacterized protein YqeY